MPDRCKYYSKCVMKGYNICLRDNSIRNKGCPCPYYKKKFWIRIKEKFEDWLWGVIDGK